MPKLNCSFLNIGLGTRVNVLYDLYTLSYQQNTDKAEKVLLRGLENIPNQLNFLVLLAKYYQENGRIADALNYYNKALEQAQKIGNTNFVSEIEKQIDSLK